MSGSPEVLSMFRWAFGSPTWGYRCLGLGVGTPYLSYPVFHRYWWGRTVSVETHEAVEAGWRRWVQSVVEVAKAGRAPVVEAVEVVEAPVVQ